MNSRIKLIVCLIAAAPLMGCSTEDHHHHYKNDTNGAASIVAQFFDVASADADRCTNGGMIYRVYNDLNKSGAYDAEDSVVHEQIVCNGMNGANGLSTLFSMEKVETDVDACESRSGLQLSSGLDLNSNSELEPSEISSTQILCDGADGAAGSAGAAGSNGYSMVFKTISATSQQCSAGGSVVLMALDTDRSGNFTNTDANQQSITLCNGVKGADGQDGEDGQDASVTAYTPVEPIYPCNSSSPYREVLLRLHGGEVLASFSANTAGNLTRLAFIPDGTYKTTDGNNCTFSLATSNKTRSISWFSKVQKTWTMQ